MSPVTHRRGESNRLGRRHVTAMIVVAGLCAASPAAAAGFQWARATDTDGAPLQVAIWYPSDAPAKEERFGPFRQSVAMNGPVSGSRLPHIVFSHGSGGSALDSRDTALALADAGFVVAAVTHPGDSFKDQSRAFTRQNLVDRTRHISRVLDFMLNAWPGHAAIDESRIGLFGHSAGAAAALIAAGGRAEWSRLVAFCLNRATDWGCQQARQLPSPDVGRDAPATIAGADPRIKAFAVAAPAVAAAFLPDGLSAVTAPVQLWIAGDDRIVSDGERLRAALPAIPEAHTVPGAGHFAFLTPCEPALAATGAPFCQDPRGFDRAAFLEEFHATMIAFYRAQLRNGS